MSDDPETARQIAELSRDSRPLLVLGVDEVLLEFVRPFTGFLNARRLDLKTTSFRLHGNVVEMKTGTTLANERVMELLGEFFDVQADWQTAADRAASAIAGLADKVEIVFLTAMPHRHRDRRRAHLDALGFPYPLVATEKAARNLAAVDGRCRHSGFVLAEYHQSCDRSGCRNKTNQKSRKYMMSDKRDPLTTNPFL